MWRKGFLAPALVLGSSVCGAAQSAAADPPATAALTQITNRPFGSSDVGGLAEFTAYAAATSMNSLHGFVGHGSVIITGNQQPAEFVLTRLSLESSRLEVSASEGKIITSISSGFGHSSAPGSVDRPLTAETTAVGILPFDLPSIVSTAHEHVVIVDGAVQQENSTSVHKVSIELPVQGPQHVPGTPNRTILDCYFDTTTHLLLRTESLVTLADGGRHRFLRVTTYGEYKTFGDFQVPTLISETLDGQLIQTLTLADFTTQNLPTPDLF